MNGNALAIKHLQLNIRWVNRTLHKAVAEQAKIAAALQRHDVTPLCVSDEQVEQLLQQVNSELCYHFDHSGALNPEECNLQQQLRELATKQKIVLPLDAMKAQLKLTEFEKCAVLLCIAPELHRSYGRIFAYIHDDLNSQAPTIGLLCSLLAENEEQWLHHRNTLSIYGHLRRLGLLLTYGKFSTEQQLFCRLAPGVLERLRTCEPFNWTDQFYDTYEVALSPVDFQYFPERRHLERASEALKSGQINLLAIWGEASTGVEAAVQAVAANSGKQLRSLPFQIKDIKETLSTAAYLKAIVWVNVDRLQADDDRHLAEEVLSYLLRTSVPLIISGQFPWRPTELLARRDYAEIRLSSPDEHLRIKTWQHLIPEIPRQQAEQLSNRFRLTPLAMVAVRHTADIQAKIKSNGAHCSRIEQLDEVCRFVSQTHVGRFTKVITPTRKPEDLVLSEDLHRQVLEVASFYQILTQVNELWGFGHLSTGAGGIKALFAGDSGTGKTLAAEVIAGQIDMPLLKIDLSQLVSKWVGETEKNIDAVFCEAELCHAMLFFDEADTLFGKRGEIQQGSDRYANLEVGYLLQRLEQFPGLVVLASNLKDEIDEAFSRRFQIILHFPRPQEHERLRLWKMAFPPSAPLDSSVDVSTLVHLDMTGAGIFNACQTAALLAANEGSEVIGHRHIIEGISRQFHRESRVIGSSDLQRFSQQSPFSIN